MWLFMICKKRSAKTKLLQAERRATCSYLTQIYGLCRTPTGAASLRLQKYRFCTPDNAVSVSYITLVIQHDPLATVVLYG
jgi:hypothetical protein